MPPPIPVAVAGHAPDCRRARRHVRKGLPARGSFCAGRVSAGSVRALRQKWKPWPLWAWTARATLSVAVMPLHSEVIWNVRAMPLNDRWGRWPGRCRGRQKRSAPEVGRDLARQLGDQGGLASPVGPDHGAAFPDGDRQRDRIDGDQSRHSAWSSPAFRGWSQSCWASLGTGGPNSPRMPRLANSTRMMSSGPRSACQ